LRIRFEREEEKELERGEEQHLSMQNHGNHNNRVKKAIVDKH
jgi:hypothetical protein